MKHDCASEPIELQSDVSLFHVTQTADAKYKATRLWGHPGRVVGGYLEVLELGWLEKLQRGVSLS